jgi:hypothetical protein
VWLDALPRVFVEDLESEFESVCCVEGEGCTGFLCKREPVCDFVNGWRVL